MHIHIRLWLVCCDYPRCLYCVNNELHHLKLVLSKLHNVLKVGGVAVIISFHSLEDRIVKNFFKPVIEELPKDIPINPSVKETYSCIKKKIKPC